MVKFACLSVSLMTLCSLPQLAHADSSGFNLRGALDAVSEGQGSSSSWSGFYVGAFAGANFAHDNIFQPAGPAHYFQNGTGASLGALSGFNHQSARFVGGLEVEYGLQGGVAQSQFISATSGVAFDQTSSTGQVGRLRGRLGVTAGPALFFAASGVSLSSLRIREAIPNNYPQDVIANTVWGWNAGAGVEYAFSPRFAMRLEYVFDRYARADYAFSALPPGAWYYFTDRSGQLTENTVRASLIYRLGAPEPAVVVAKY